MLGQLSFKKNTDGSSHTIQEAADKKKEETAAAAPKKDNVFNRVQNTNVKGQTEVMSVEDFLNKFVR